VAVFVTFNDGSNPAPPPAFPHLQLQDSGEWDWEAEWLTDDEFDTEPALGLNLILLPSLAIDDAWDWDQELAPEDEYDSDYLPIANLVLLAALTPDDQWEWESDRAPEDEYETWSLVNVNSPIKPANSYEDDEPHIEGEPEDDFFDHFGNVDALQPIYDEAWSWDDDVDLTAPIFESYQQSDTGTPPLEFPLLGQYLIAGSVQTSWGTSTFQAQVATLDAAIISIYPGWTSGGYTFDSAAAAVKAINPNIALTQYVILTTFESGVGSSGSPWSPEYNIVNAANYWLRATWPSGTIQSQGGSGQCLNVTTAGVGNGSTLYVAQRPVWSITDGNEWTTHYNGVYIDNFNSVSPVGPADFLQNGTSQSASSEATIWQNGMVDLANNCFAALPAGGQVWGNTGTWNPPVTAYQNLLTGGVMESIIGQSSSYESQGWSVMMSYYKGVMLATKASANGAKYQLFSMETSASTNYTALRYGITACLLDNAYFGYDIASPGNSNYSAVNQTDETNFNLGAQIAGPNSTATGTYSNGGLTVWKQGVYRRDFVNGIMLHNPRGNGPQTVTLETTYYELTSTTGDPVNTGAPVTSVALADSNVAMTGGDGRILSRTPT
jgi:Hypothetical glycosyl hydrolase family 15